MAYKFKKRAWAPRQVSDRFCLRLINRLFWILFLTLTMNARKFANFTEQPAHLFYPA